MFWFSGSFDRRSSLASIAWSDRIARSAATEFGPVIRVGHNIFEGIIQQCFSRFVKNCGSIHWPFFFDFTGILQEIALGLQLPDVASELFKLALQVARVDTGGELLNFMYEGA